MSKIETPNKLKKRIETSIQAFQDHVFNLISLNTKESLKRASLFAYWLNDYIQYHKNDDTFNPLQIPKLERGNIVQVHLGYRIGRELGGRHYAVVLDKKNYQSSPIVTVVPLQSLKENFKENKYRMLLDVGLYTLVESKLDDQIKTCRERHIKTKEEFEKNKQLYEKSENKTIESVRIYRESLIKSIESLKNLDNQIETAEKTYNSLKDLKAGSILSISQITTISKQRIMNPKMKSDSLFNIKLDKEDMKKLNDKLKNLYITSE